MEDSDSFVDRLRRRRFLRMSGALGVAGLAGCSSQEELQGETDTPADDGSDGTDGDGGDGDGDGDGDGEDGDGEEADPLPVGTVIPFSGDLADFGEPMLNAMRMAQEDINAAGGPLGREVDLLNEDSGTDSTQAVNAAEKLVNTNDARCIIGAVSSGVTISIANSVTIPNEILQITSASSSPTITTLDDNNLVWRTRLRRAVLSTGSTASEASSP